MSKKKATEKKDLPVEDKLKALFNLQLTDSEIDKIRILRGELPLEVQDLEDEIEGLETRIQKYNDEIKGLNRDVAEKKNEIQAANSLKEKYESQQMNVRNNREYDSLSKEIEYQGLEIELCEKRIKEFLEKIELVEADIKQAQEKLDDKKTDLSEKQNELHEITGETKKEEEQLIVKSQELQEQIEERLLTAYKRIRENARNGLAVVSVERDACGGCFNKIPPQRQMDIKQRKKIIVCEYCGRILVDGDINKSPEQIEAERLAKLEELQAAKPKKTSRRKKATTKKTK